MKTIKIKIILGCLLLISPMLIAQVLNLPDKQIERNLENEYFVNQLVHGDAIDVSVSDAVAVIDGEVSTLFEKRKAEDIATMAKGVKSVVNQLEVQSYALTDAQIQQGVEKALLTDPATEAYKLTVKVNAGNAKVFGEVESFAEKELIDEVVASVRGVRSCEVSVDINHAEERKDVSLEEDILGLVRSDVRIEPKDFSVDVDQGKMIVEGEIGTAYEKNLIQSHAWSTGASIVDIDALEVNAELNNNTMRNREREMLSDDEIKEALHQAFLYDARVKAFPIEIEVHDGIVHLEGNVSNLRAKMAAKDDAMNIVGVKDVTDDLKVKSPSESESSDVEERVQNHLDQNVLLTGAQIQVENNDGIVTLSGTVESNFLRYVAESTASGVYGVTSVENEIETREYPGFYSISTRYEVPVKERPVLKEKLPDEVIENDIEYQLLWSPYVDFSDLSVEVSEGVAIIEGQIDSERERRAVIANAYEGGAIAVESTLYY